jgi:hypothetical protein
MLTPDFVAKVQSGSPVTPGGGPAAPQDLSDDGAYDAWKTSITAPAQKSTVLGDIGEAFNEGVGKIGAGINEAKPVGGGGLGGIVPGIGKIVGGAAQAITAPLAPVMKPVGAAIDAVTKPISDNPTVQKFANSPAGEATANVASTVGDYANAAGLLVGGKAAPEAGASALEEGGNIVSDAKNALKGTPEQIAAKATAKQAKAADAIDTEVRNTAAKYPTVGKVLNQSEAVKGTDPISVLSSYAGGKALPTLVKGKLQTDAAVNFLKSQVSKLGETKSNLNFLNDNAIPLKDFQQRALDQVDAQTGWSAAKKADAKAQVGKLMSNMKDTYGDQPLSMSEVDKLKTEHTTESTSYNSKSPFSPDAHAIVGKAARDIVSMHADGAPIDELNKLMSSHYAAIDLLNSMRGKTPHGGALSKMTHNVLGEVAGFAGGTAVGHPFLGAMAGRAGAEFMDGVINNHFISNPLKRTIVNSMKGADPEALNAARAHMDSLEGTAPEEAAPAADTEPKSMLAKYFKANPPSAGLSTKADTSPSVSPATVAQNADATDIQLIKDYLAKPADVNTYTKAQPMLGAMGLNKLSEADKTRFLKEVLNEKGQPRDAQGKFTVK